MKSQITKVTIKNFRSHKDSELKFGRFTAILGQTNGGKSASIDAVKFCLYNRPSGDDFIRKEYEVDEDGIAIPDENGNAIQKGELDCEVETFFDNGKSIFHFKGPKDHYYILKQDGQEVITLRNFGNGPVKEVCDFHGMYEVNLFGDKESLNFCPQMDSPFFLGESAQTRGTMIGKMAHVEAVDIAIKNVDSEMRAVRKTVKDKKSELKEINDKLKEIKGLSKMEKDLKKVASHIETAEKLIAKSKRIEELVSSLKNSKKQRDNLNKIINQEEEIKRLITICDSMSALMIKINTITKVNNLLLADMERKEKLEKISNIDTEKLREIGEKVDKDLASLKRKQSIESINKKLSEEKNKLQKLEKIVNSNIDIDGILTMLDTCKEKLGLHSEISKVKEMRESSIARKEKGETVINKLQKDYDTKMQEYKGKLREHKKCPTCMGDITDDVIDQIKDII